MSGAHKKELGAVVHGNGVMFRVWAPFADSVAVTGSFRDWEEAVPMEREHDGCWAVTVPGAQIGQEYRYVIKNGDKTLFKNDPRALKLTTTEGNSVVIDTQFDWTDQDFHPPEFDKQVIYETHVGTYYRPDPSTVGTFADLTEKLDYLAGLGVTTIELMPICTMSPIREWWGYTPMYIYAVESQYGGRHELMKFVNAAHERGLAVMLDVVYNHLGPESDVPYDDPGEAGLDLWRYDGWQENGKGGIYFYNDWRGWTPWGFVRPDYGRPEVQQYILDNVRMWLQDCHIDGLRVDSTIYMRNAKGHNDDPDNDLPDTWPLLQRINKLANHLRPEALIVAEDVGANEYITRSASHGGAGFAAQWEVCYPQALRDALGSDDVRHINLAGIIGELGRRYNDDAMQRVLYVDSHDSAANGSARFNEVVAPGKSTSVFARRQVLLAAVLMLTAPGIPMILQGQEFVMTGSFTDWEGLKWDHTEKFAGIVEAYKHLIALRKNVGGVSAGLTGKGINIFHVNEEAKVIAFHRWRDGGRRDDVVVVVNFSDKPYDDYGLGFPRPGTWRVRFCSTHKGYSPDFAGTDVPDVDAVSGTGKLVLPASTALIFSQD